MADDILYRPTTAIENSIEYLYKYRSLSEHTEKIITQNQIYFSPISKFNDPFDCKCDISIEYGTYPDKFDFLYKTNRKYSPGIPDVESRMMIASALKSGRYKDIVRDVYEGIINNTGVFCLSATKDNILLWSHYAYNHKGICIQFSCQKDNPYFGNAHKVNYQKGYPTTEYFKWVEKEYGGFDAMPLIKSDLWSYENEYRMIRHNVSDDTDSFESLPPGYGVYSFPEELLTGIIFGCMMEDEDKEKVRDWISHRKLKLKLYLAKMKEKEFGLNIIPIK